MGCMRSVSTLNCYAWYNAVQDARAAAMSLRRWGASFSKSACTHKATKAALSQLTQSLSEELKEAGLILSC